MFRQTVADVQLHGQTIPEGKFVLIMVGSANRDPLRFSDAARFDIARDPNPHIGFGHGIHYCLGAALARMELAAAFRALATRFPRLRANGRVVMRPGTTLRGPRRLPVAV
jgi:cytochrome P450